MTQRRAEVILEDRGFDGIISDIERTCDEHPGLEPHAIQFFDAVIGKFLDARARLQARISGATQ